MIKMVLEQDDSTIGLTQWWELSKKYKAIIFVQDKVGILHITDDLRSKHVKSRHDDPVRVLYPLLINKYMLNEEDYIFQQTVYGSGIIHFRIENKIKLLEMIDHIIHDNPTF